MGAPAFPLRKLRCAEQRRKPAHTAYLVEILMTADGSSGATAYERPGVRNPHLRCLRLVQISIYSISRQVERLHYLSPQPRLHLVSRDGEIADFHVGADLHPRGGAAHYHACAAFTANDTSLDSWREGPLERLDTESKQFRSRSADHVTRELGVNEETVWQFDLPELPCGNVSRSWRSANGGEGRWVGSR